MLLTLFGGHPTGTPGLQLFFSHIYNYSARAPIDLYAEPVATLLKPKPKKRLRNRIEISWIVERRKTRTETERNWDRYWNREWVHSVNLPVRPIRMYSLAYPTLETRLGYTPLPSQVRQCDAGLASSSRSRTLLGKTGLELIVIVQFDFAILIVTTFYNWSNLASLIIVNTWYLFQQQRRLIKSKLLKRNSLANYRLFPILYNWLADCTKFAH